MESFLCYKRVRLDVTVPKHTHTHTHTYIFGDRERKREIEKGIIKKMKNIRRYRDRERICEKVG